MKTNKNLEILTARFFAMFILTLDDHTYKQIQPLKNTKYYEFLYTLLKNKNIK